VSTAEVLSLEERPLTVPVPAALRSAQTRWLLTAMLVCWMIYDINGFRPPWSPIIVSDLDSGTALRQALFSTTGLVALYLLATCRALGPALVQHIGLVTLGLSLLASTVCSADPVLTVKRAAIFNLGMISLIVLVHQSRSPVRSMQKLIVTLTATAAWISILGWFVLPADAVSLAERPGLAGVTGHPNTLAPCMVIGFLISLGMAPSTSRGLKARRLAQAGLLVALLMTDSITSFVLLLVGCSLQFCMTARSYRRGVGHVIAATLIGVVFIVGTSNIKQGLFRAVDRDPSLSGRSALWVEVMQEGLNTPWFGQGFGAFWYEGRGREIVGTWNPRQSHHAYVDVFVDLGLFGLALVLLIFAGGGLMAWARTRGVTSVAHRRVVASMIAVIASLLVSYAFGESFLLKLDKFPMFCLLWFTLLLQNRGAHRIGVEFDRDPESHDGQESARRLAS